MSLEFRREILAARFLDPATGEIEDRRLEIRFDPLLGTSARIAEGVRQLRGTSVNPVPDVEHVLVTAGTGVPTSGLILG